MHLHVILHEWIAFCSAFWISSEVVYLQRWHGWCHMKLLPSQHVLCTPYDHTPCHFMEDHICKVHTCLAIYIYAIVHWHIHCIKWEDHVTLKKKMFTLSYWQQHTIFRRNVLSEPQLGCCWLLDWTENLQTNLPAYVFFQNPIFPLVVSLQSMWNWKKLILEEITSVTKDYTIFCLPKSQYEHKRIVKTSQCIWGRKELS